MVLKREEDDRLIEIQVDHVKNVNEVLIEEDNQIQMVLRQIQKMMMKMTMNLFQNTLFNHQLYQNKK